MPLLALPTKTELFCSFFVSLSSTREFDYLHCSCRDVSMEDLGLLSVLEFLNGTFFILLSLMGHNLRYESFYHPFDSKELEE